ncbi:MAG: endonuclease/exonuclease/phosphatase family protein, partial [Deltaproteobacteria bacterium]|nr:endonuclease/exonuclease/phosphatase family protein [Deltaproteobacteria bacterium]
MYCRKISIMRKPSFLFIILISLWITLSVFSAHSVTHANSGLTKEKALELRIMSFNIRFGVADDGENSWSNRREVLFGVIDDFNPDVVGLQEDFAFQTKEIIQALPGYGKIAVSDTRGSNRGIHNAILYRMDRFQVEEKGTFWFSDTPEVPGSKHWGNHRPIICTWAGLREKESGQVFYIYNVHLDYESPASREKSVVLLAHRITQKKNSDTFVVTGDFNSRESSVNIMYLKGGATLPG